MGFVYLVHIQSLTVHFIIFKVTQDGWRGQGEGKQKDIVPVVLM